jgi:hypothetical protein
MEKIPLYVRILAKLIPILEWDDGTNLSTGEIRKFNFIESQKNQHKFGSQVSSSGDGYDYIWRHISDDYFKCIGKSVERTC